MIGRESRRALLLARHSSVGGVRRVSKAAAVDEPALLQFASLERLAHQSRLHLRVADSTTATIRVVPTLQQSEFALHVFATGNNSSASPGSIFEVHEAEPAAETGHVKAVELTKSGAFSDGDEIDVLLSVPHLLDLDISIVRGAVALSDKIEGDVRIAVGDGNIAINKVRGEQIQLKTNRGRIDVSSLVEGEKVKMAASAVKVKRLMSSSTEIKLGKGADDSGLGAVYSSLCLVNSQSTGTLEVGNIHGFLRVNGEAMKAINVHSVNGALHLEDTGSSCSVVAHFDAWSPEAANGIFVGGDVRVSLDPSAPIDLELHGSKIFTEKCKFGDHELDQLDEDFAIFTGALLANASASLGASSSGKINVGSAKTSALRTSFFAAEKDSSEQGATSASSDIDPARLPRLVVHASSGSVTVEQLDWMGKIKRKHLAQ